MVHVRFTQGNHCHGNECVGLLGCAATVDEECGFSLAHPLLLTVLQVPAVIPQGIPFPAVLLTGDCELLLALLQFLDGKVVGLRLRRAPTHHTTASQFTGARPPAPDFPHCNDIT